MREPKPFFRKQTKSWYVKLTKDWIPLGKDRDEAFDEYHKIMLKYRREAVTELDSVSHLLDLYWNWVKANLAESTAEGRKPVLRSFKTFVGPKLRIRRLKPYHVNDWIAQTHAKVSDSRKNTLITIVKAALQWAADMGYIDVSPIAKLRKPRPAVRQEFIPADLWQKVLDAATNRCFRELLEVMLTSGARVQEMFKIESRHLDRATKCLIFDKHESKGKTRNRVIWLPDSAFAIVSRLANEHEEGKLFRNGRGRPWDKNSIRCRFRRLKKVMNMPKLTATTLRHSFAHFRLTNGQDSLVVSKLMGHVDGRMLATRYGHLEANSEFMSKAANALSAPLPEQRS